MPIHYQIQKALIRNLAGGKFQVGDRISCEVDLCRHFGVSRATVRQAVGALVHEGLLERRRAKGIFVSDALRGMKRQLLVCLTPDVSESFYGQMVKGTQHCAREHGFGVTIYHSDFDREKEARILHELSKGTPRALLLCSLGGSEAEAELKKLVEQGLPVVMMDYHFDSVKTDVVENDNIKIGRDATEYLIGLGHKKITFVGYKAEPPNSPERKSGYREAMSIAGLAPSYLSVAPDVRDLETVVKSTELQIIQWFKGLAEDTRPTALFVTNDTMAIGVCRAVQRLGLSIPDQIGVMGVANVDFGKIMAAPLTSIDQKPYEMGFKAAELAIQRILGQAASEEPIHQWQEHVLIERESTRRGISASLTLLHEKSGMSV